VNISDVWNDLRPAPDRIGGTLRITFSAVLVAAVMLTFRMPFLYIGPYLVFILSQRDTFLTRAAATLGIVVAAVASLAIYLVAWTAWDTGWLRVSLWGMIFFGGYFLMRMSVEPRAVLGPLVVVALFAFAFDKAPDPNTVVSQIGWLWAILGLIIASTFLTQWIFQAPTGIELLRRQLRELLVCVERRFLARSCETSPRRLSFEEEEAADHITKLGMAGVLSGAQARNNLALLRAGFQLLRAESPATAGEGGAGSPAFAAWTRQLRRRVLLGSEAGPSAPWPDHSGLDAAMLAAAENLRATAQNVFSPAESGGEKMPSPATRKAPALLLSDWSTNPAYPGFALRATLATMGCYLFMTLTDWNGIHTCLITCAVTALAGAESRIHKQNLRMTGALIGGLLGMGCVIFLIPRMDSLAAYLGILAVGTAFAAWVSLGSERISYAGWQIGLAFYMTVLQAPHPTAKLDIIRDRWAGIFIGILAMRVAFEWFPLRQKKSRALPPCGAPC
jgi:multidrug resistance protein MdtO